MGLLHSFFVKFRTVLIMQIIIEKSLVYWKSIIFYSMNPPIANCVYHHH
jgi:hypothetical protein